MDYQSNSMKEKADQTVPEKKIEKVTVGEVVVKKKSIGRKFKDVIIAADVGSVFGYIVTDVLIPAVRNTIVDASTRGIERLMYGESHTRRQRQGMVGQPRYSYNTVSPRSGRERYPSPQPARSINQSVKQSQQDFILVSREEAERVVERMNDIIDMYDVVTLGDLNELLGFPSVHTDNKWGWGYLGAIPIRQIREGYLLDLPPAEAIRN